MWQSTLDCEIAAERAGFDTRLWVLSAGWGFIPADKPISSYAATFAIPFEDSVARLPWPEEYSPKERSREWWSLMNSSEVRGPRDSLERMCEEEGPEDVFLFVLSREYYQAVEHEILRFIGAKRRVVIASAGLYSSQSTAHPMVREFLLPINDKFKQICPELNTTNTSLNAVLARWVIERFPSQLARADGQLFRDVANVEESLSDMERKPVVKMTDEEVLKFIEKHHNPGLDSATRMLRYLRHSHNLSCEQKRFGKLFAEFSEKRVRSLVEE